MSDNKLGEFIKSKRLDKHLTREKLAQVLNISASHLNAIERGLRFPSRDLLRAISNELGIDLNQLYSILDNGVVEEKPKSRIPDLPDNDPPLEEELREILNDPNISLYFSKTYLSRLSNRQLRQIALNIKMMAEENEDRGQ